ncbi:MAG: beta strand repeat-containing protein [Salibacteraceae bacterium]
MNFKCSISLVVILINSLFGFSADRYWVGTTNNNWNEIGNWSTSSGGVSGASVPGSADRALFNSSGNVNCTLDMAPTVESIDISVGYTSTIDLNGNNLTVNGATTNDFEDGTFNNTSGGSLTITCTGTTRLRGTIFNPNIDVTSNRLYLDGSTYNGTATFTKTGPNNDAGTGGNTFNGATTFICSGSGYLMTGNTNPDTFNGVLTCNNTGTSGIYLAYNSAGTLFNQNIIVNSTGGLGIRFGQNTNGSATLAAARTITVGGSGFTVGELRLKDFTQTGATAQNIALTGTGYLYLDGSDWGGNVTFSAPRVNTRDSRFRGTANITKNGASDDQSPGGNQFDGNTILTCSSSGYFMMGNGTADSFDADLTINNTGTRNMYLAHNGAGHSIDGNLTVTNSGTGTNTLIYISNNTSSTLAISGNVDITISGNSTTCTARFADNGDITVGGNVNWTNTSSASNSDAYIAQGTNSSVNITGNLTAVNAASGANSRLYIGSNGDITVGGNMSLTNTTTSSSNGYIYCNHNSNSVAAYNGNITLESTGTGSDGILFGENGGSSTLAATRTFTIIGGGFTQGDLRMRNFVTTGATAQSATITGTGTLDIHDCNFGGDITFIAPRFFTRGTTYQGTATLTKTGAGDDRSSGGNVFTGNATLNNSGTQYFLMGDGAADVFSANVTMNNTGTHYMYLAYNSAGNSIAGNLTINHSTSGGNSYIYISDLAASTLSIGGNAVVNVTSSASDSRIYFSDDGDVSLTGNLTLTNSATGASSNIYASQNATSALSIGGNAIVTNSGGSTTKRVYLGNQGDIALAGTLSISNSS